MKSMTITQFFVGSTIFLCAFFASASHAQAAYMWTEQTGSPLACWNSVAMSQDMTKVFGSVLGITGCGIAQAGTGIHRSIDSGSTWSKTTAPSNPNTSFWKEVSVSGDGSTIYGAINYLYGGISRSTDGGATWSLVPGLPAGFGNSVDMSADGSKIIANIPYTVNFVPAGVYLSLDGGTSWATTSLALANTYQLVISADGSKIAAAKNNGSLYISSDNGATWSASANIGLKRWMGIEMSANGQVIVVTETTGLPDRSGAVYISKDGGSTWNTVSALGSKRWGAVAVSADGLKIVVSQDGAFFDYLYVSSDGGTTWAPQIGAGQRIWTTVDISPDGTKLLAASRSDTDGNNGSITGGHVWTAIPDPAPVISAIAVTETGNTATITWNTSEAATSTLVYGLTNSYGSTTASNTLTATHSVTLTGLNRKTTYHYKISVADNIGQVTSTSDLTFKTEVKKDKFGELIDLSSMLAMIQELQNQLKHLLKK